MDKEVKKYEISFLVRSEAEQSEIIDALKKRDFSIINKGQISKIKLTFPVKKEPFAYFGYLYFSGEPRHIQELNHDLKTNFKILRFNIIAHLKEIEEKRTMPIFSRRERLESEIQKAQKEITFQPAAPAAAKRPIKGETLSNEALEKKLEEILK
jgi:ribosomal protein S6